MSTRENIRLIARAPLLFLLPPSILRLYTGCRLDHNFSKFIIDFQKVKVLNY